MTQQTATETCSCGATLTITTDLLAAAERALTTWRNTHKHHPHPHTPPTGDSWDGTEFTYPPETGELDCRDAIHTSQGVPLTGRHNGCTIHAGTPIGTPSVILDRCLILPTDNTQSPTTTSP